MRSLVCLGVVLALVAVVRADDKDAKVMKGKIVSVNADSNTITIRDENNKEHELKTTATTRFVGADKKPLTEGLKFQGFKEGTQIWYRTGADATTLAELRLSEPENGK